MAFNIAFDVAVDGGNNTLNSLTYSHTCTGANRYLLVGVVGAGADQVTGVTYAAVSMTLLGKVPGGSGGSTRDVYLFGLANPASGANNVVISASGGNFLGAVSASYTGVNQGTVTDTVATAVAASAGQLAQTITPDANGCWLVQFTRNDAGVPSAGAGTTMRATDATAIGIADGNGAVIPASATTLTQTKPATAWSGVIVAIAPLPDPLPLRQPSQQSQTLLRM